MTPPKATLGTRPITRAATPDSKAPISLLLVMKKELTADTRPISSWGVWTCSRVWRRTTLTLSRAPLTASRAMEKTKLVEKAKAIQHRPKKPTHSRRDRPALRMTGRWARTRPMRTEPTAGAARSSPRPWGPTFRTIGGEHREERRGPAEEHPRRDPGTWRPGAPGG